MKKPIVSVYLDPETMGLVTDMAARKRVSRSSYIVSLIRSSLASGGDPVIRQLDERLRSVAIGVDALLKHHPNPELRGIVRATIAARRQEASDEE